MSVPAALLVWIPRQWCDDNGDPLAGGKLKPYVAGTSLGTPKLLYADAQLTTALPLTIALDAGGRVTAFMDRGGYDIQVLDVNGVVQYVVEGVEDIAGTFFSQLGTILTGGSKSVTSGYTLLPATDVGLVTIDSSAGASTLNLCAAASYTGGPVSLKNMGGNIVSIVPNGSDTIESLGAAFSLPAAVSPKFPTVELASDHVSAWWIRASHGL